MCATYLQWAERFPEGKRLMYLCGEDRALVHEVYQKEMSYRPIRDLDLEILSGRESIADITAALYQYSKGGTRVVVIHDADKIKKWEPVMDWCRDSDMRDTVLICVGNDVKPDTKMPHLRPFIDKGRYVECKSLSDVQVVDYILSSGRFTPEGARALYDLTSGDMMRVLNEMRKLQYVDAPVSQEVVEMYVEPSLREQFVEALMANNKHIAMSVAHLVTIKDLPLAIGSLEYDLANLLLLTRLHSQRLPIRELAERAGIPLFLIRKHVAWAQGVSPQQVMKRIKVLSNVDMLYRRGHSVGVLERLVVLWVVAMVIVILCS